MALQFASSALVRYVTEKVMETVMRQISEAQRHAVESAGASGESTVDVTAVIALSAQINQLSKRIDLLNDELAGFRRRVAAFEKRYGWGFMLKMVAAVVATFMAGFGLGFLAKLAGWF